MDLLYNIGSCCFGTFYCTNNLTIRLLQYQLLESVFNWSIFIRVFSFAKKKKKKKNVSFSESGNFCGSPFFSLGSRTCSTWISFWREEPAFEGGWVLCGKGLIFCLKCLNRKCTDCKCTCKNVFSFKI